MWRLGQRPALDGLRGIAILLVLLAHGEVPYVKGGGTTGVTMFFVLSGFLITTLLLEETERTGRISLGGFYERRARRLLPAAVVTVAAVALIGIWVEGYALPGTGWGTLFYYNNWVQVSMGGAPRSAALNHAWSLSVEEQFYAVAPFVVLALRRRPGLLAVLCSLGAVGVLVHRLSMMEGSYSFGRIYLSTDTRADALLIGMALAGLTRFGVTRVWWPYAAFGALFVTVGAFTPKYTFAALGLMPFVIALATVPLVLSALGPNRLLDARWLRWVGRRSYGLYLYHYPIVVLLWRAGAHWPVMLVGTFVGSFALAALSWRYLEQPFLKRSGDRVERSGGLPGGVLGGEPVGRENAVA